MSRARPATGDGGFTMAELLVACAIIGLVMSGLLTLLLSGQQSFLIGAGQVEAQQNVRVAFDLLAREVRQAGYDPTRVGFAPIVNTGGAGMPTATALMLQNDWNANGVIEPGVVVPVGGNNRGEQVRYAIINNRLTRQESAIDGAPQVIIAGIDFTGTAQPAFQYRDATGNVPAAPASIASVIMMLQTRPATTTATLMTMGNVHVRLSDTIRLRNR